MYNPDDSYIQMSICRGINFLKEAIKESTDKQKTIDDICSKLNKETPIYAETK